MQFGVEHRKILRCSNASSNDISKTKIYAEVELAKIYYCVVFLYIYRILQNIKIGDFIYYSLLVSLQISVLFTCIKKTVQNGTHISQENKLLIDF